MLVQRVSELVSEGERGSAKQLASAALTNETIKSIDKVSTGDGEKLIIRTDRFKGEHNIQDGTEYETRGEYTMLADDVDGFSFTRSLPASFEDTVEIALQDYFDDTPEEDDESDSADQPDAPTDVPETSNSTSAATPAGVSLTPPQPAQPTHGQSGVIGKLTALFGRIRN